MSPSFGRARPGSRKPTRVRWHLPDLLDFAFLLEQDRECGQETLAERDRNLYGQIRREHSGRGESVPGPVPHRSWLFREWLEKRRETLPFDQPLPGEMAASARSVLSKVLAVIGAVSGAGLAAKLLEYDGVQPVNVAAFLGWLVLLQIVLALSACLALLTRGASWFTQEVTLITGLIRWLWSKTALALSRHAMERLSAERRQTLERFFRGIAGKRSLYGDVALWPLWRSLQSFGMAFNLGALTATVLLVVFSDRAFGWQSAVPFDSRQVHAMVEGLGQPWAWLWPEAVPTLGQVEGSRIVLKDGIKQLATENLVSWWPFLCLALLTYGLMPRVVLWAVTWVSEVRAQTRLTFHHVACDRLYERMTAPVLATGGEAVEASPAGGPAGGTQTFRSSAATDGSQRACLVLPEELAEEVDQESIRRQLAERFQWETVETRRWPVARHAQAAALSELQAGIASGQIPATALVLVEESWQPPIGEKLEMLRSWRAAMGDTIRLMVLLIGRPGQETYTTEPSTGEVGVWQDRLESLGDGALRLESWVVMS